MSESQATATLTSMVDDLVDDTDGDEATVGELLSVISTRSFGPLLLIPSLILLSPLGGIPGMPAIVATVIVLMAGQMIAGRAHPWLPQFMLDLSFDRQRLIDSQDRLKSILKIIGKASKPRLQSLVTPTAEKFVAATCIVLALTFLPLGFVPFAVAVPAAAICVMSLGLMTRDGLLTLIGLLASVATLAGAGSMLLR